MILNCRVTFYVPSESAGIQITDSDHNRRAESVARVMAEIAGGATVDGPSVGYWHDGFTLVRERVVKVSSFLPADHADRMIGEIRRFAGTALVAWQQEAIALEIDGTMHLITSSCEASK